MLSLFLERTKFWESFMSIVKLNKYMQEREKVRIAKEAGKPKPWTKDHMLRSYRFCNVRREDDKVTRWIRENWREPYADHPNLFPAIVLARLLNLPESLEEIGFPEKWNPLETAAILKARKARGEQLWNGAYMVTAGGKPVPKEDAVVDIVDQFYQLPYRPKPGDTLLYAYTQILAQSVSGIGTFLTAQFIADLKYTPLLRKANDWWEFCAPGPGSVAGLAAVKGDSPLIWNQIEFQGEVNQLRVELNRRWDWALCAQDVQNCLCEYSKYTRGYAKARYQGDK